MAKEDSLNIYLNDDLIDEIEKQEIRYHKTQMVIHLSYSNDELKTIKSYLRMLIQSRIKP